MHESSPAGTVKLLARRAIRWTTGAQCIQWATEALVSGFDSPALRVLAGLDPQLPIEEVDPCLVHALQELAIPVRDADHAVRQYVDEVASHVVEGTLAPRAAVELLHREAVSPLGHPQDLLPWCYLRGGLEAGNPSRRSANPDDAIRDFARKWLRQRGA